ncbi:MAG TPA: alpha/beta fold hydrolase, partial [Tepidisphaeraceae bacterium]|nr:alpha/beta fold hydrolase [Tepidisphaeraceae bacterium]
MRNFMLAAILCLTGCAISHQPLHPAPQSYPQPVQGDYVIKDFHFQNGQILPELRIHYRTLGQPRTDSKGVVRNAVLILHGTSGSGAQFTVPDFAGELFGKNQPLDASHYFIILPDDIGHGQSSKPSDGLHAKFPAYGYRDMLDAEYRLVTDGLHVNHLRLCMGTSMGGMHTWLWGELHPDFTDALMPLASLPAEISGRNRMWRKMIIDDIRTDPDWKDGEYTSPPHGLKLALEVMYFMSDNPRRRYQQAPTGAQADKLLEDYANDKSKTVDANDLLYALESSRDYDPAPALSQIQAPLLAINSADDLINPPDLGILETSIKNVKHGRAIVLPESPQTRGHGTHTLAWIWKGYLHDLLQR